MAPGVGLEPARPRRATGSQARLRLKACALIHSANGMVRHVSDHYPGVLFRHQTWSAHLIRSILKCLPQESAELFSFWMTSVNHRGGPMTLPNLHIWKPQIIERSGFVLGSFSCFLEYVELRFDDDRWRSILFSFCILAFSCSRSVRWVQ